MPTIATDRLTRTFGPQRAVSALSIAVDESELFGLLGHNGAGKTTTLRLINRILSPTEGAVRVLGADPYTQGAEVRRRTGVLTESPALDGQLSVTQNLRMYGAINGLDRDAVARSTSATLERLSLEAAGKNRAPRTVVYPGSTRGSASRAAGDGSDVTDAMIRLEGVSKVFPGLARPAVDDLSLDVPEGEVAVLVGPSGCGKTTTLKMINRLIEPTSGSIHVAGREIRAQEPHELRRSIGYVIQQIGLFPHRTIRDNIATVPRLLGWQGDRIDKRVDELIELMGLDASMRDRYPAELSGGQRQRVGVARALAADPPVLLMDEPFGAVDPIVRSRLQQELLSLQERVRKTIVFVTHDIDEAVRLGDRIAILNVGGVLEQYGPPRAVLADPANAFVEDFLGSERGLKRLSLIPVTDLELDRGPVVDAEASVEEAKRVMAAEGSPWVGVLDGQRMRGWVWGAELEPGRSAGEHETHDFRVWIESTVSLREALDAIVNTRNQVAVVYERDVYLGMLRVEQVSAELLR